MGFRMRRSFSVVPGLRVNVSAKSVGVTVGGKIARTTINSRTGTRASFSVPGTGVSYTTGATRGPKGASTSARRPRQASAAPTPLPTRAPVRPGLFAPKGEKELFSALAESRYADLEEIAGRHPEVRHTCMLIDAFKRPDNPATHRAVRAMFEELWRSGYDPGADPFIRTYVSASQCSIDLAPGISATVPFGRLAIGLALAELRQEDGELVEAASVVEALEPSAVAAVSLAELYGQLERWNAVVDLTDNVTERDDLAIFLLIQRGIALRELRHYDAAREALKAALARRSQPAALRHLSLLERGLTYAAEGKRALAKKDLEKILAEDGKFPGLAEALASLS